MYPKLITKHMEQRLADTMKVENWVLNVSDHGVLPKDWMKKYLLIWDFSLKI